MFVPRYQDVTLWSAPVNNGVGGYTFAAPIALKGRWEERIEQVVDSHGNDYTSNAQVYLDTDVQPELGAYLYRGASVAADPTGLDGARVIMRVDSIPDLHAIKQVNKAYL